MEVLNNCLTGGSLHLQSLQSLLRCYFSQLKILIQILSNGTYFILYVKRMGTYHLQPLGPPHPGKGCMYTMIDNKFREYGTTSINIGVGQACKTTNQFDVA